MLDLEHTHWGLSQATTRKRQASAGVRVLRACTRAEHHTRGAEACASGNGTRGAAVSRFAQLMGGNGKGHPSPAAASPVCPVLRRVKATNKHAPTFRLSRARHNNNNNNELPANTGPPLLIVRSRQPEAQGPVSTRVLCMSQGAAGTHASWQRGARA